MKMIQREIEEIKNFWKWFLTHCNDFGEKFENEKLINELDERILDLGNFVWEIGPGVEHDNMLVISPGGDPDLLEKTKEIISYATLCKGWEFYYSKQPKEWDLIFILEKDNGDEIEIDGRHWQYTLLKFDDGMFKVIFKAPGLSTLSADERLTAAEIILDGILGEEFRILTIEEIEVVDDSEDQNTSKINDISILKKHLKQLNDWQ
nr:hypothetical protein [Pedobacter sp. ASV19]